MPDPRGGGEESSAARRLATLQALTARLARATSVDDVARLVLHEGVERLEASTASLCLVVPDGQLEIAASFGYPKDVLETYRRFPIDDRSPAGVVVRSRRAVYARSRDDLFRSFPAFRTGPLVADEAFAVLPLESSDGRVLGAMVIGFAGAQDFGSFERELLESVALEAGAALERAYAVAALVQARAVAEVAREQLAFLAEASSRLAATLSFEHTLETIGALAVPRIADRCILYLAEAGGEVRKVPVAPELGEDERRILEFTRFHVEDRTGPGAVIGTGEAEFVPHLSEAMIEQRATPEQAESLRRLALGSMFVVPLQARGRCFGALGLFNLRNRRFLETERALGEELAARSAVALDHARMFEQEMRIAEILQLAMLPDRLPVVPGLELAARYRPGTQGLHVGGDWYDVLQLDEGRVAFVVGDVSGHGVQAARMMSGVRHAIRAYALEGQRPGELLGRLGRLLDMARDGHFATVLFGICDVATRAVTLANAGHLEPLLVGRERAAYLSLPGGPPVGVGGDWSYDEHELDLPPDTALLAFTDGLVERRGEHLDLGLERLRAACLKTAGGLEALADEVVLTLLREGADDDSALLALRIPDVP